MTGTQSVTAMTLLPPMVLTFIAWLGLRIIVPSPASSAVDTASMKSTSMVMPAVVPSQANMLRIAAWGAVTPFGDAGTTISGSRDQEKIFRLDNAIRNADGHPVHAAAVEELRLEDLGYPGDTRSRPMRVAAMLVTVLNTLYDQQSELANSSTSPATVYCFIPATMRVDSETRLYFATAWLHSSWKNIDHDLHLLPSATENVYSVVNNLQTMLDPNKMSYILLLAADSLLDPGELMMPLAENLVFSGQTADGFIPAEGAAGLLLVDAAFATRSHLGDLCSLGPVQQGLRVSDRTAKGKIDSSTLTTCITEAMAAVNTTADRIGNVINDTDHRFSRAGEVIETLGKTLPDLDPLSQRINPMAFAGSFGAASDLIHLVLGADAAAASEQAALVVSVTHVRKTAAVVIGADQH